MASKTIAVDERVWRRLKEMMEEENVGSLGETKRSAVVNVWRG
jgi:predicted CopG family antitoxin